MLLEVGHDRCRDGNGADASIGLRWPEYGGAVGELLVLLDHPHRSMEQIDALHSQRPDLAESQPAERRQQHSGPEFGLDRVGRLEDLFDGRHGSFGRPFSRGAPHLARIAQHDAVFDRGREHCMNESVALRDRRGSRLARCDHAGAPRADPAR